MCGCVSVCVGGSLGFREPIKVSWVGYHWNENGPSLLKEKIVPETLTTLLRASKQKYCPRFYLCCKGLGSPDRLFYCSDRWAHWPCPHSQQPATGCYCHSLWMIIWIVRKVIYSVSSNLPPCDYPHSFLVLERCRKIDLIFCRTAFDIFNTTCHFLGLNEHIPPVIPYVI